MLDEKQKAILLINILLFTVLPMVFSLFVAGYITNREQSVLKKISGFTRGYTEFDAFITLEPSRKHSSQEYEVTPLGDINIGNAVFNNPDGNILVRGGVYLTFEIGQLCNFSGELVEPKNSTGFDYKTYLKNRSVYLTITNPVVVCSGKFKGYLIQRSLGRMKNWVIDLVEKNLKEPQSSLFIGILIGQKRLFSKSFEENIRIAGISHIVAASGYNVTILLLVINTLLKFVPKRVRIIISLVFIWGFCILAGMSSSIVRACIMTTISLLALFWGRNSNIHITFVLCMFFFVLIDPKVIFDVGFQLSICATFGLIYLLPSITNALGKINIPELILTTLSCTISTLPVSIYTFKTFSLWSILANTLILPVIESTMLFGTFGLLFSSRFLFRIVHIQLKYVELITNLIGFSRFGHWELNSGIIPSVIILLCVIFFCIYFYPVSNEEQNYYIKIFK